jgi:hypothetical protein
MSSVSWQHAQKLDNSSDLFFLAWFSRNEAFEKKHDNDGKFEHCV